MSPGSLDAIRREIGLIMGWKAQSYTARGFADDLNQLYPELASIAADSEPYRRARISKRLGRAVRRLGARQRRKTDGAWRLRTRQVTLPIHSEPEWNLGC